MKPITIAIDGYSSCGKSTLAKALAKALNYTFIDSGAMYRGVTLFALQNKLIQDGVVDKKHLIERLDEINLSFIEVDGSDKRHLFLNNEDVEAMIRTMNVANHVSAIATIKEVRDKLVALQRKMSKNGGVVMDGRDIGSVVFPQAELKFFVTAHPEIRAKRRFLELTNQGKQVTIQEVAENLKKRDELDTNRSESPLIQVADAIELDNSNMTPEEQLTFALEKVKEIINQPT
jgi:cytidylate kinase